MRDHFVHLLARRHGHHVSLGRKMLALVCGGVFFLLLLPAFCTWLGAPVAALFQCCALSRCFERILAFSSGTTGLFFLAWATYAQITAGQGTPNPIAPTQRLVCCGPYALTRNPIEFGALLYYFAFGTLAHSFVAGLVCLLLVLVFGSAYHKFVEEMELKRRFGLEYLAYKQRVPFLLPRLKQKG
ncbi:MAG: isoprenylcysteine carboxylmethyltransferase family protein [Betaproteobacteria bacterium]|nr:isoprenylcysteine carboxylmethyltransferase family protein [Betaproteobacteria bacterium]